MPSHRGQVRDTVIDIGRDTQPSRAQREPLMSVTRAAPEVTPGAARVQDMAVDTFLKICHKCKRKFVTCQVGEREAFVAELLRDLSPTIKDLELHQINVFYESVALMIAAEPDEALRNAYLVRAPLFWFSPPANPNIQYFLG